MWPCGCGSFTLRGLGVGGGDWYTFNERQLCSFAQFSKGVYCKRKEFAPKGSKFFPFRVDFFPEGHLLIRKHGEVKEIFSLVKNGGKSYKKGLSIPLKIKEWLLTNANEIKDNHIGI